MAGSGSGKGKRRGCFGCAGCLGLLVVGAVVLVVALLFGPKLLRNLGIFGQTAEEAYSGAADPLGTELITDALEKHEIEGVQVVVMPIKGSPGQTAFITVDDASRFGSLDKSQSGEEQMISLLESIGEANRTGDLNVDSVALSYAGEDGEALVTVGVTQDAIDAYAAGEITKREFVRHVEIDYSNIISPAELKRLAEEQLEAGQ